MTLYEYQGSIQEIVLRNIFSSIPSAVWGFYILLAAILLAGLRYIYHGKNPKTSSNFVWSLGLPSLMYLASFIMTFGLIDEVAINLEHVYNWIHYGRFSMSPDRMVDGTVEFIYYLLHGPFGSSQRLLILGNFLLGLLVGWLHLWILWRFWMTTRTLRSEMILSVFAMNLSLVETFSSGFGNGLVSLAFLSAVTAYKFGRIRLFSILLASLPLIRPDGLLVSLAGAGILWLDPLKQNSPKNNHKILLLLAPFFALSLYFLGVKVFYGHWIPTPLVLKSVNFSMFSMFDAGRFILRVGKWILRPWVFSLLTVTLGMLIASRRRKEPLTLEGRLWIYLFVLLLPTFFYVEISNNIISVLREDPTYSRYWTSLLVVLFMAGSEGLRDKGLRRPVFLWMIFAGASLLSYPTIQKRLERGFINRNYASQAGSLVDRVAPSHFRFACAEMNTFGLASERFVTDLFGYSTPEIAHSKKFNIEKMRCSPNFFNDTKPDLAWLYWFSVRNPILKRSYDFDSAEDGLLLGACGYYHGDLRLTLQKYDLFFVNDDSAGFRSAYLIRHDGAREFQSALARHGFAALRQRPLKEDIYQKIACPVP